MAKKYCPNCYYPLPYKAKFCAHCAQKNIEGKVSVKDLLQQVWFKVFHMESNYYRAMWRLLIPGQVSIDYFNGQRKRYPPPIQFFFVIMFLFLLVFNYTDHKNEFIQSIKVGWNDQDSTKTTKTPQAKALFPTLQKIYLSDRFRKEYVKLPAQYQDSSFRYKIDSILLAALNIDTIMYKAFQSEMDSTGNTDSINISVGKNYKIAIADMYTLETEEIAALYGADSWYDRLAIQQGLKVLRDPEALLKSGINSLAWTILVLIIFGAGLLWLLHIRKKRYYVEHLFFLLHLHSGDFLLLTTFMLLTWIWKGLTLLTPFLILWMMLASFIAMYRYYGQGWGKTFLKWALFGMAYLIFGLFIFLGSMLVLLFVF